MITCVCHERYVSYIDDRRAFSLVESPSQTKVAHQSIEKRHCNQYAQLKLQCRSVYPHVVQQHFGIIEMAVHFVAIQPLSVVSENYQYDGHDTSPDEGCPHQPLHYCWNLWCKIEPVDGQSEEWCYRQWTDRRTILK